jgi:hypothetical protein
MVTLTNYLAELSRRIHGHMGGPLCRSGICSSQSVPDDTVVQAAPCTSSQAQGHDAAGIQACYSPRHLADWDKNQAIYQFYHDILSSPVACQVRFGSKKVFRMSFGCRLIFNHEYLFVNQTWTEG